MSEEEIKKLEARAGLAIYAAGAMFVVCLTAVGYSVLVAVSGGVSATFFAIAAGEIAITAAKISRS